MSKVQEAYEIVNAIEQAKQAVAAQFADEIKKLKAEIEELKRGIEAGEPGGSR